jgi:hypothetical protein
MIADHAPQNPTPRAVRALDEYRKIDAVNWSCLKWMVVSPKRFRAEVEAPHRDSPAMRLGRLEHCAVLEPDELMRRYCAWNGGDKRSTEWKAFKAAATLEIIDAEDYDLALKMRDAARSHPAMSRYLSGPGENEISIAWTDQKTGLACKARIDRFTLGCLMDLKTARDISQRAMRRAMLPVNLGGLGYAGQFAFYRRGLIASGYVGAVEGMPCVLGCIETFPPYECAVYSVAPNALANGNAEIDSSLAKVAECRASGVWPGGHDEEEELDFDDWFYASEDAEATKDPVWIEET